MRIAIIRNKTHIEITEIDKNDVRVFGMQINLYKNNPSDKWNINWGSNSYVSIEVAKNQITLLELAVEIAKKENTK